MGTFSTSIPNFRGRGQLLDINVEYGRRYQNFRLGFTEHGHSICRCCRQAFYTLHEYYDGETNKVWVSDSLPGVPD